MKIHVQLGKFCDTIRIFFSITASETQNHFIHVCMHTATGITKIITISPELARLQRVAGLAAKFSLSDRSHARCESC